MPTKRIEVPSKESLLDKFYYKDGFIYWKERKISRNRDSERAHRKPNTWLDQQGYYRIVVDQISYFLSRIIYQIHYGDLTIHEEIDHFDRNKENNIITNLRKVPQEINKRNKPKSKKNSSGDTGVQLCRKKHPAPYEHQVTEYFVARWIEDGKQQGKNFRIDKLGYDEAYKQACEYREKMIQLLIDKGVGYSDTHGK